MHTHHPNTNTPTIPLSIHPPSHPSGHFTAPAAGTYEFHLNLLSDHDHSVWQNLCVVVNTACVALTTLADSATLSLVLQLQQGDAVSVLKRDGPGSSIYGINHTTFSGVLVSPAQ